MVPRYVPDEKVDYAGAVGFHLQDTIKTMTGLSFALSASAALLMGLSIGQSNFIKPFMLGGAFGLASYAEVTAKKATHARRQWRDFQGVSDQALITSVYQAMQPHARNIKITGGMPASGEPVDPIEWFDWQQLRLRRDAYPHMFVLTKTGGGKSTLAEYLASLLNADGDTDAIAVVPHYQVGDYPTATRIIGAESNVGHDARPYQVIEKRDRDVIIGEVEISLDSILSGAPCTACQLLNALLREMRRRYVLDPATGKRTAGKKLIVILDEFPIYSTLPGVKDVIKALIREARKVDIRLIIIAQGAEVKTLGIEGEGSLRENLTFIRLTNFAVDHCKYLRGQVSKAEYALWDELYRWMKKQERPCLVEDQPAVVPDLSNWKRNVEWNEEEARRVGKRHKANANESSTPPREGYGWGSHRPDTAEQTYTHWDAETTQSQQSAVVDLRRIAEVFASMGSAFWRVTRGGIAVRKAEDGRDDYCVVFKETSATLRIVATKETVQSFSYRGENEVDFGRNLYHDMQVVINRRPAPQTVVRKLHSVDLRWVQLFTDHFVSDQHKTAIAFYRNGDSANEHTKQWADRVRAIVANPTIGAKREVLTKVRQGVVTDGKTDREVLQQFSRAFGIDSHVDFQDQHSKGKIRLVRTTWNSLA